MAGSRAGGLKSWESMKKQFGREYFVKTGALGGAASRGYKFAHGKLDPRETGRLGGLARRGKPKNHKVK